MFEGANPRQSTCIKCKNAFLRLQEDLCSILLLWFLLIGSYIYSEGLSLFTSEYFKNKELKPKREELTGEKQMFDFRYYDFVVVILNNGL